MEFRIEYVVDEKGNLKIFGNKKIMAEISHCENKTKEEIEVLIGEVLDELDRYVWFSGAN